MMVLVPNSSAKKPYCCSVCRWFLMIRNSFVVSSIFTGINKSMGITFSFRKAPQNHVLFSIAFSVFPYLSAKLAVVDSTTLYFFHYHFEPRNHGVSSKLNWCSCESFFRVWYIQIGRGKHSTNKSCVTSVFAMG